MDDSHFDGISSFLKLSGANVPSRARFVGEAILSATLSSLTLGFVCGHAGAIILPTGPIVPFLFGSWTGYSVGLFWYWKSCKHLAQTYAQRYPTILAHALWTEQRCLVPRSVVQASVEEQQTNNDKLEGHFASHTSAETMEEWIHNGGLMRLSWTVLAAQSCRGDVEEVERQARQKLMEEHVERLASSTS